MAQPAFVHLVTIQGDAEAQIVRGILESGAVRVLLSTDVPHSVYPINVDGLGMVRIQVPADKLEKARARLDSARKAGLILLNGVSDLEEDQEES